MLEQTLADVCYDYTKKEKSTTVVVSQYDIIIT